MDLIITSRMASSRLPGKALKEVIGFGPMLKILIDRAKLSNAIERVIIATTDLESDDVLVEWAESQSYLTYRGSENDVLKRIIDTCDYYKVDNFIEILGDNPLVVPDIIKQCVEEFQSKGLRYIATMTKEYDYADLDFCFPIGMRVQVISSQLMHEIEKNALDDYSREHATSYIYDKTHLEDIELFRNEIIKGDNEYVNWNYAVNDLEGFNNMAFIINKCGIDASLVDIISLSKQVRMFN